MNTITMIIWDKKIGVRHIINMNVQFVMVKMIKMKQKWKIFSMMQKVYIFIEMWDKDP